MGEDEIHAVSYALGQLKSSVDDLNKSFNQYADQLDTTVERLGNRITALERWKYSILGASGVIAFLVELFLKQLGH